MQQVKNARVAQLVDSVQKGCFAKMFEMRVFRKVTNRSFPRSEDAPARQFRVKKGSAKKRRS